MQQDKLMLKISQPLLKLTQESESIILVSSTKERAVSNGTLYAKLLKQKNKFGIELSLGTKLQSLYPKPQIALIKHALSGSNLYQQWNPGNRQKNIRGEEYINFIKTVKDAIISLKQQGYRPIIKAMVWQQGEADARDIAGMEQSRQYSSNLKNFIEQIRKEFNSENMLFVYGTVIPIAASRFTGRELVRKAQFAVSNNSNSEFSVNNALLIPADDLQMLYNDYQIQHLKMMYI